MSNKRMTRRKFLARASAIAGLAALAAACGPTPTPKIVEKVVTQVVEKPVTKVVQETVIKEVKVPAKVEKSTLRVQVYGGTGGMKQREFGELWAQANPNATVKFEEMVYAEISQKTEMAFAAGDPQDILYGHSRWHWMGSYKGFHLPIDDLLKTGIVADYATDYYETVVENEKWEGKTDCILDYFHCGGNILLTWNRALITQFGAKAPEPGMTMDQLKELALKCTDKAKGIFGLEWSSLVTRIYVENICRAWGKPNYGPSGDTSGWMVQPDGKKFKFYKQPGPERWYNDIYRPLIDAKATPLQADVVEGGLFVAGRLTLQATAVSGPIANKLKIGTKFDYQTADVILLPVGPDGRQGTCHSANMMMVSSKCKYPEQALSLIGAMTSMQAAVWATLTQGTTAIPRKSYMTDAKIVQGNPGVKLIDGLASKKGAAEPFGMPWNLRDYELTDILKNTTDPLFQGTKKWEEQAPIVEAECQKLLDQPRP